MCPSPKETGYLAPSLVLAAECMLHNQLNVLLVMLFEVNTQSLGPNRKTRGLYLELKSPPKAQDGGLLCDVCPVQCGKLPCLIRDSYCSIANLSAVWG